MDFLARTIGSFTGPNIPYTIGDVVPQKFDFPSIWKVHEGIKKADNTKCTLFVFDAKGQNSSNVPLARNMVSKLKKLRIPGVVKILESVETETSLIIATEHVRYLYDVVDDLSVDTKIWGLHNVFKTMDHVSNNGFTHGNINLGSIFVNDSGEWLIAGLELATKRDEEDILFTYGGMLPGSSSYAPPEVTKSGWQTAQRTPMAVDAYHLGCLIHDVFNGTSKTSRNSKGKIPSNQLWNIQKQLSTPDPKRRATVQQLQKSGALKVLESTMVEVEDNLASLSILSADSFGIFLTKLSETHEGFPKEFLHYKVLPQLIESMNRNGGNIRAMTMIIQLSKGMPTEEFNRSVTPTIVKMFAIQDRAVRLELVNSIEQYIGALDKKTVSDKIFGSLSTGFTDSEPVLREATLKCVIHLIPKLNDRIINGELLRLLAKTQNDSQPEIRANTTILLGRISECFSANTRTTVLIAAFARALKDPFVQSRIAALLALSATADYYNAQDICAKVIGPLAPSLIDKDKSVRDQARITMDTFMTKIKNQADNMGDSNEQAETENAKWSWPSMNSGGSERVNSAPALDSHKSQPSQPSEQLQPRQLQPQQQLQSSFNRPIQLPSTSNDKAFDDAFDDTAFDDDPIDDDAWGQFSDDDTNTNTKKVASMSLEPEEDAEDEWGWD